MALLMKTARPLLPALTLLVALGWAAARWRPWRHAWHHAGTTVALINAAGRVQVLAFSQEAEDGYFRRITCPYWIIALPLAALDALAAGAVLRRRARRRRPGFPIEPASSA